MENRPLSSFRDRFASPRVSEEASLKQVVATVQENAGCHDVCVVNDEGRLLGVINIKKLFRTIFFHHADPNLMTRQLMELTSSETAGHLMISDPVVAQEGESLGHVIKKMVRNNLGELPVVDDQGHLLGSVAMKHIFDVWLEWKGEEKSLDS